MLTFGRFLLSVTACALGYVLIAAASALLGATNNPISYLPANLFALFIIVWVLSFVVGLFTVVPASLLTLVQFQTKGNSVSLCLLLSVGSCLPPPWDLHPTLDVWLFAASVAGGLAAGLVLASKEIPSPTQSAPGAQL